MSLHITLNKDTSKIWRFLSIITVFRLKITQLLIIYIQDTQNYHHPPLTNQRTPHDTTCCI